MTVSAPSSPADGPPDSPPPLPPPRTTSIRLLRKPVPACSKSLLDLAPTVACQVSDRQRLSGRTVAGPHHHRHMHSSSSSSSSSSSCHMTDTFLQSMRREFSVPEFRLRSVGSSHSVVSMSLSTDCVQTLPSDCSTSSSGVLTCPSLSSLSAGSPDNQTKGLIVRSARVEQPERQHVSAFVHFADSSAASVCTTSSSGSSGSGRSARASLSPGIDVHCVSRGLERLSVVSSGGTSSSSGMGVSCESGGESGVRSSAPKCESPPPLPPKLQSGRSNKSTVRYACIDVGAGNKQTRSKKLFRESDRSCKTRAQESPEHRLQSKFQSNCSKNNGFSIGGSSKSSDRRTCEKSSERMIYLDALRRVKTSDTEIRAIQKRALMQFYLNCFNDKSKKTPPVRPHIRPPVDSEQTAFPARVIPSDSADQTPTTTEHRHQIEGAARSRADGGVDEGTRETGKEETTSQLTVLQQEKQRLMQQLQQNQDLGSELMSKLKRNGLSPHESEKIRNHCSEIDTVTRLVLSLRCRLRSMDQQTCHWPAIQPVVRNSQQNNRLTDSAKQADNNNSDQSCFALQTDASPEPRPSSPESSEHHVLARKRHKLLLQMEEALSLKDMIEKRSTVIRDNILSKYLESEANESIDYIALMYQKCKLITDISDVSQRINSLQNGSPSVTTDVKS